MINSVDFMILDYAILLNTPKAQRGHHSRKILVYSNRYLRVFAASSFKICNLGSMMTNGSVCKSVWLTIQGCRFRTKPKIWSHMHVCLWAWASHLACFGHLWTFHQKGWQEDTGNQSLTLVKFAVLFLNDNVYLGERSNSKRIITVINSN